MDFKEDQLAIEAHVRMRCNWRDDDEISDEEWLQYSLEYIAENPFAEDVIKFPREAMMYDRISGEVTTWKRIPGTEFYWQSGEFWYGMSISFYAIRVNRGWDAGRFKLKARPGSMIHRLGIYMGLIES